MRRVTAFVGAARRKHTYEAVQVFLSDLETLGDVETEIVRLGDYHVETCRGCKQCFVKGEEYCPLKDDRDVLIQKIVEYLDFVGWGLGFNVVKGTCHTAFEPMTERERLKRDRALAEQARRFHSRLVSPTYPVPTLFGLMAFRMGRTSVRLTLGENDRDYRYYREHGWFESDYWYPTRLDLPRWAAGKVLDRAAAVIYGSGRSGQARG